MPLPDYRPLQNTPDDPFYQISHSPTLNVNPGKSLRVNVSVESDHPIKWVHLMHRPVNQEFEYARLAMTRTNDNSFEAIIPAEEINIQWDYMYYFEVMDENGHGIIYPDLDKETPYVFVKVIREPEM